MIPTEDYFLSNNFAITGHGRIFEVVWLNMDEEGYQQRFRSVIKRIKIHTKVLFSWN